MSRDRVVLQLSRKEYKILLVALDMAKEVYELIARGNGQASLDFESDVHEDEAKEFGILKQLILNEYDAEGNER